VNSQPLNFGIEDPRHFQNAGDLFFGLSHKNTKLAETHQNAPLLTPD
jgi:hypothetical protein